VNSQTSQNFRIPSESTGNIEKMRGDFDDFVRIGNENVQFSAQILFDEGSQQIQTVSLSVHFIEIVSEWICCNWFTEEIHLMFCTFDNFNQFHCFAFFILTSFLTKLGREFLEVLFVFN
jgi:hypothetical protein